MPSCQCSPVKISCLLYDYSSIIVAFLSPPLLSLPHTKTTNHCAPTLPVNSCLFLNTHTRQLATHRKKTTILVVMP